MSRFIFVLTAFTALPALAGCSSSYHPEYHPVSVSNVSQSLSYPVVVTNGGGEHSSPMYILPGPAMVATALPPPPPPPPSFFAPE